jgi:hypothetical protein
VAVGMGVYPNMEAVDGLVQIADQVEPIDDGRRRRYNELYREYRALYEVLAPVYRRLHTIH